MYLPIYVVRHYVANFYFPLLLCTHTFIYSDVMSPFFLSVLKVSTQFFHDADLIGAAYMAKTCNLFTYYCYSQAEPITNFQFVIELHHVSLCAEEYQVLPKNRHQGALLDEYAAPGGAEDILVANRQNPFLLLLISSNKKGFRSRVGQQNKWICHPFEFWA